MTESPAKLACPSASADDSHARIIGVVVGAEASPRVQFVDNPARITPELRETLQREGVEPGEVFRLASRCQAESCHEFANGSCSVGRRVSQLAAVGDALPACTIRASCRWFAEHGAPVCLRCPQVVTFTPLAKRRLPLI